MLAHPPGFERQLQRIEARRADKPKNSVVLAGAMTQVPAEISAALMLAGKKKLKLDDAFIALTRVFLN